MRIKRGRFRGKHNCMELLRNYPYRYGTNHDVATFGSRVIARTAYGCVQQRACFAFINRAMHPPCPNAFLRGFAA